MKKNINTKNLKIKILKRKLEEVTGKKIVLKESVDVESVIDNMDFQGVFDKWSKDIATSFAGENLAEIFPIVLEYFKNSFESNYIR